MLKLLTGFAALALIAGALMSLLPEGSLRSAASMAIGLVMLLYWFGGLQELLQDMSLPMPAHSPVLTSTGITLQEAEAALLPEETP